MTEHLYYHELFFGSVVVYLYFLEPVVVVVVDVLVLKLNWNVPFSRKKTFSRMRNHQGRRRMILRKMTMMMTEDEGRTGGRRKIWQRQKDGQA